MNVQQTVLTGKEKACKICGYIAKHQGALNMHSYHCKVKHMSKEPVQKHFEQETCEHSWRLLSARGRFEERQALAQGYNEVCTKCHDVK